MEKFIAGLRERAKARRKRIVLCEGEDTRIIAAAQEIIATEMADVVLIGNPVKIKMLAEVAGNKLLDKATIIDPSEPTPLRNDLEAELLRLREKKGMTAEKAAELIANPVYLGVMLVHAGFAHGMVGGAALPTSDILRPALQILKTKPGISVCSGAFLIVSPHKEFGTDGRLLLADCAVTPDPTAEQLADIAQVTAKTAMAVCDIPNPKVAMMSFSTKGSAKHPLQEKMAQATLLAQERYPDLPVDGEMQLDAALVPSVAQAKAPGSPVAGQANVLIFPDLNSGNLVYKAMQRFGQAYAFGPILQGIGKPVNDLSRGCTADDVVNTAAIVCLMD